MSPSVTYEECSVPAPASYEECEVGGASGGHYSLFPGAVFPFGGVSWDECSVTPAAYEECEVP